MSLVSGQQSASQEVVVVAAPPPAAGAEAAPEAPALNVINAARALGVALRPLFPDASVHAPTLEAAGAAPQNPELAAIEREQRRFYATHAATDDEARRVAGQLKRIPIILKHSLHA
jgi:hypothetical protein